MNKRTIYIFGSWVVILLAFASGVGAEEKVQTTDYHLTLEQAVDIQVNASAKPISSAYETDPAYLEVANVHFMRPVLTYHIVTNARKEPNLTSPVAESFVLSIPEITGIVEGTQGLGDRLWYEVLYEQEQYYILAADVFVMKARVRQDMPAVAERNPHAHAFGDFTQGEEILIKEIYPNWIATDFQRWRMAKPEDIAAAMDLAKNAANDFQHLRLDSLAGVSAAELDRALEGKGSLAGEGAAFVNGASAHGINEAYLIAHAFLESGHGSSELASGVEVGVLADGEVVVVTDGNRADVSEVKTVYNMFGIGAVDSCPLECGAQTAYNNDWTTPAAAIEGGAAWIGAGYIYNDYDQNTLYKMKWNPRMFEGHEWKQYATDIGWAEKQTGLIKTIYEQLDNPDYHYDYPKFND